MNGTRHREVGDYLRRLQRSMSDLPAERRDEILAGIEEHIAENLAERPAATDADVRNILERVGDPAEIAAEARQRLGIKPASRTWTDPAAIILLLVGGFTIIGWFVGVVLLWISDAWNTRDKIIGTFVVPGGLAGSLGVGVLSASSVSCEISGSGADQDVGSCISNGWTLGSVESILWAVTASAPIITAVYLSWRLRRARLGTQGEGGTQ
jgi:hypothetical protein